MGTSKTLPLRDTGGNASDLLCPRCGAANLHHTAVDVFERCEDAGIVKLIKIDRGTITSTDVPNDRSGNPSMRRGGITVGFDCEQCGDGIVLQIAQHKGSTEISFVWLDDTVLKPQPARPR